MRIIKFRAWHKENKIMYDVDYIDFKNNCRSVGLTKPKETTRSDDNRDLELMQFTGLKDKNGKEIYEGDIIRYSQHYFNIPNPDIKQKGVLFLTHPKVIAILLKK